jgi:MarR family transcriptional regulator, organic hydroperoxide resistance regulator
MKKSVPLEMTVMQALIKAAKTYLRAVGARLAPLGLQPGQDMFLKQLWHEDDMAQSALIERLGVEPPTVAKALGRLEREGYLTRRRDRKDARVSRISLTARGKKLRAPVEKIWKDVEALATEGMTDAEKAELRRLALGTMMRLKAKVS